MRLPVLILPLALWACSVAPAPAQSPQEPATSELRERAYGAENRGDFAAAADAFLELGKRQPDDPEWVVSAGRCLGLSARYAAAIDLLDAAKDRFPGMLQVPAMLARTWLLKGERDEGAIDPRGDIAEAARIAEGVLAIDGDQEDSRLILAQARYLLGDWDEAVTQARQAVERHPQRPGAHILLGRIAMDRLQQLLQLHEQGELSGQALADLVGKIGEQRELARREFARAAALDDSRAHPHIMLARLALLDGDGEAARRHLLDALAIDPNDGFVDHGRIAAGLDWQARAAAYAEVRARYEARPGAVPAKAATLRWYEAAALYEGRQWQAALDAFEAVLAANPDATNSHYYAALAAYELGDHDLATRHAAGYAAVSAPAFADVVKRLGAEQRGQVAAILKFLADRAYQRDALAESRDLNHVIALLYDTAEAWNNHAFLCRETGEFEAALTGYRRALEREPTSAQLHNDTAVVLHYHLPSEEHLAEARTLYARAIELADKVLADASANAEQKSAAMQARSDAQQNLEAMH
ncbi:MAG: tetratricopeptide repeat protein, partial [Planctomycetes bacterium]|nr:tetratricopeptide repeat protein [Planctomycetota bacterium]